MFDICCLTLPDSKTETNHRWDDRLFQSKAGQFGIRTCDLLHHTFMECIQTTYPLKTRHFHNVRCWITSMSVIRTHLSACLCINESINESSQYCSTPGTIFSVPIKLILSIRANVITALTNDRLMKRIAHVRDTYWPCQGFLGDLYFPAKIFGYILWCDQSAYVSLENQFSKSKIHTQTPTFSVYQKPRFFWQLFVYSCHVHFRWRNLGRVRHIIPYDSGYYLNSFHLNLK